MAGIDLYVRLMMHADGENNSTVFLDSSFYNSPITAAGGAIISTTGGKFGSGCASIPTGYLSLPASIKWNLNNGFDPCDFAFDFWYSSDNYSAIDRFFYDIAESASLVRRVLIKIMSGGNIKFYARDNSAVISEVTTTGVNVNDTALHHIVVAREGISAGCIKIYVDGAPASVTTATEIGAVAMPETKLYPAIIGREAYTTGTYNFAAKFDELRLSVGTSRWTATFTPPTEAYSYIDTDPAAGSATKFLSHMDADFSDSSLNNASPTVSGSAATVSGGVFGNAGQFPAVTDYVTYPPSLSYNLAPEDYFTIDFRWKITAAAPSNWLGVAGIMADTQDGWGWTDGWGIDYDYVLKQIWLWDYFSADVTISKDVWHHLAFVKHLNSYYFFLDGVSYTVVVDRDYTAAIYQPLRIGGIPIWGESSEGLVDEFRITLGQAKWTENFTPPVVPYVAGLLLEESLSDSIDIAPSVSYITIFQKTVDDALYIRESVFYQLAILVQEALGLTDSATVMLCLKLSEFLTLAETHSVHWVGTNTVNDGLVLSDEVARELCLVISDALALTDSSSAMLELIIAEFLAISEAVTPNWNSTRTVNETLRLVDLPPMAALSLVLTEALTIVDAAPVCHLSIAIYEYLGFKDLVSAAGRLNHSLSDGIALNDSVQLGFSLVVSDALSAVDAASVIGLLGNVINESLVTADAASGTMKMTVPVTEALTLTDAVSSQGILYNVIYDTLHLGVTVELDGEIWECYVLNTPKFLPSIYSGFDFNSYCVFENRAYGCRKLDGIHELTGDTDNGVAFHTGVQFSDTTFGIPNQKRFRKAYVGVTGTSPRMVMETEKGLRKVYKIDSDGEVDASRALRSKKWKLTVTDFDTLDFVKLYPIVLAK